MPLAQDNPAPVITVITPSSAQVGDTNVTLKVQGSNFITESAVIWNGTPLTVQIIDSHTITATVPGTSTANEGTVSIAVRNPAPGGGASATVVFNVVKNTATPTPPATTGPNLTSLSPGNVTAGGPAFNLAIRGSNFVSASTVKWNGTVLATNYISATQLSATIPQTAIANAGTAGVSVSNPTPGGGNSSTLDFTINQANPVPAIISLPNNSVKVGSGALTLTVNGVNFIPSSVAYWNGMALSTHLVNSNQLTAYISAVFLATSGTVAISVTNPAPGGGNSNAAAFTVASNTNPVPGSGPTLVQYNIHQTYGSSASGGPLVWENDSVVQFKAGTKPGNTIWVVLTMSDYAGVHNEATITDTQGNTYFRLDQVNDPVFMPLLSNPTQNVTGGAQSVEQFYATRIAGDSGAPDTITVHWNTEDYKGVLATEISSTTGTPLVGFNGAFQDNLLSGTNNISSGNIPVNSGQTPALLMALSFNTLQTSAQPSAPKPGIGFTQITTLWDWATGTGPSTTLEMKSVTSGGNLAGIFSAPGTDNYVTVAAVFH